MDREANTWRKYAVNYDPIKIGSIDATDTAPHDRALLRALHSCYSPSKSVKGDPRKTIFVGRLNPRTTLETIQHEFSKFGKIHSCSLIRDIVTGKSKRYAFVEYEGSGAMHKALGEMNGEFIDGAEILVEIEAGRNMAGWRPRRLGGGFGGRKESGQLRFGCRDRPFKRPILLNTEMQSTDPEPRHKARDRQ